MAEPAGSPFVSASVNPLRAQSKKPQQRGAMQIGIYYQHAALSAGESAAKIQGDRCSALAMLCGCDKHSLTGSFTSGGDERHSEPIVFFCGFRVEIAKSRQRQGYTRCVDRDFSRRLDY